MNYVWELNSGHRARGRYLGGERVSIAARCCYMPSVGMSWMFRLPFLGFQKTRHVVKFQNAWKGFCLWPGALKAVPPLAFIFPPLINSSLFQFPSFSFLLLSCQLTSTWHLVFIAAVVFFPLCFFQRRCLLHIAKYKNLKKHRPAGGWVSEKLISDQIL